MPNMGFAFGGLWGMGYCGLMGYGIEIPAHRVGGFKILWDIRGYGLSGLWVKRSSTVCKFVNNSDMNVCTETQRAFVTRRVEISSAKLAAALPCVEMSKPSQYIIDTTCLRIRKL